MRIQTNIQKGLYNNLIHEKITPNIPEISQALWRYKKMEVIVFCLMFRHCICTCRKLETQQYSSKCYKFYNTDHLIPKFQYPPFRWTLKVTFQLCFRASTAVNVTFQLCFRASTAVKVTFHLCFRHLPLTQSPSNCVIGHLPLSKPYK